MSSVAPYETAQIAISAQDVATDHARLRSPRKFGERSRQWFWKVRTAELVSHCGGYPTPTQAALIERFTSLEWELRKRIAVGDITFAERLKAEKALRRDLRELGLESKPKRAGGVANRLTIAELLSR